MHETLFEERYNNLEIYTHNLEIETGFEIIDATSPLGGALYTTVIPKFPTITDKVNSTRIITGLWLMLRNQGGGTTGLQLSATFVAESATSMKCSEFLLELSEYLYVLAQRYIAEVGLKDSNGSIFVTPGFNYSKANFEGWD